MNCYLEVPLSIKYFKYLVSIYVLNFGKFFITSVQTFDSLLYGAEDPSIAGLVLDSAFSNLYDLMMELVDVYKIRVPKFTVCLSFLQNSLVHCYYELNKGTIRFLEFV